MTGLLGLLFALAAVGRPTVTAVAIPSAPYVEDRGSARHLNFDVILHNTGDAPLRLVAIRQSVYGPDGGLRQKREVNANGRPSALSGLGELVLPAGGFKDVYQPFQDFEPAQDGSRVVLTFVFLAPDRPVPPVALAGDQEASVEVTPRSYHPAPYHLPLAGRLLVHDGHDLYSHHRRRDLAAATQGDPLQGRNANLYAYDFVRIDADGAMVHGSAERKQDWLTYGAEIRAPVDGVVVEAVDGVAENRFEGDRAVVPADAQRLDPLGLGDHVLIRAPDGRVVWLLHMEPGSVAVKAGDRVTAGEAIGRVGFSGDSLFPHLHLTVTDSAAYPSQGVPSYFTDFCRAGASPGGVIAYGQIDTGDIVAAAGEVGCR